jgi:hypothetical protein
MYSCHRAANAKECLKVVCVGFKQQQWEITGVVLVKGGNQSQSSLRRCPPPPRSASELLQLLRVDELVSELDSSEY